MYLNYLTNEIVVTVTILVTILEHSFTSLLSFFLFKPFSSAHESYRK